MANPSPYLPSFLKASLKNNKPLELTFNDVKNTNILSTSSFLYDPPNTGLKNTQQLNVDWSKFENHTFFSSAEAKVNLAFDQIINGYPFDGTRTEIESYFEKLTGFDKWVLDNFPHFKGQLLFSGSLVGEDTDGTSGTWIKIKDFAGALYPEISSNRSGDSIINPKNGVSFTLECQLFVPEIVNDTQVIFQKLSGSTEGITLYLSPSLSTSSVQAVFAVNSGSSYVTATGDLIKGRFNHICATLNRESNVNYAEFYLNEVSVNKSKSLNNIGDLSIDASDILIGTGSSLTLGQTVIVPTQTFSGSIDELRIFHSPRSISQQQLYAKKAIYASDDLKLYYRFNEPPPPLALNTFDQANAIVLDSSGNSLHAVINNFFAPGSSSIQSSYSTNPNVMPAPVADMLVVSSSINSTTASMTPNGMTYFVTSTYYYALGHQLRQNANLDVSNPMIYEKFETYPVLFPAYPETVSLNEDLLSSASLYDKENPNLITRLIPQHYLLEGTAQDGTPDLGENATPYSGNGIPGQGVMSSAQIIVSFLYIWARFFDEMKLFLDSFSTLKYLDYTGLENSPNNFLYDFVKSYGFNLPPLFNDSNIDQFINAENIGYEIATSAYPLKTIQNEILRRVLINMPNVIKSKGTQHAIKSFFRAVGINPDNSMRIREFGGPTTRQLTFSREKRHDSGAMVEFPTGVIAKTPFLSGSRVEVGFPTQVGNMVQKETYHPHGISDNVNDGLLTSGSWTVEGIYKWTPNNVRSMTASTQSLARLCITGSQGESCIANLLAISSSYDPKLVLYVRPGNDVSSPALRTEILLPTVEGLFNHSRWNISFGRYRSDDSSISPNQSSVSSSYFIRVATQNDGDITFYKSTSSYFHETQGSELDTFCNITTANNASGAYLVIGENQQFNSGTNSSYLFLNNISAVPGESLTTDLTARVSNLRFWSKGLTESEFKEHTRNYKSLGVDNPLINYNFNTTSTGSWNRVRVDTLQKQYDRYAVTGTIQQPGLIYFIDYSMNNMHMTGTGFTPGQNVVLGEIFDYSYLSPYFDEASCSDKIRVRGYLTQELIDSVPWAQTAPVHEILRSERPTDDVRLSIEFSLIDALNRDIVTMFSTFDALDNALGNPELLYSPDYPDLERLREIYFNRISTKLNFQDFFEFFRWFDKSLSTFIEQLIPKKTKFKGTNFVIESHMLERHKLQYMSNEIYLGEEDRSKIRDVLLVQQIVGSARKY